MESNLYVVYDEKIERYSGLHVAQTHGQAMRGFADACQDQQIRFSKHPQDYSLYFIGTYNDENGEVISKLPPTFIARASEFIKQPIQGGPHEVIDKES